MIYTFYSFKGGAGRSMALANIAELLYRYGLKVLMVDFDLEAPGLERFFDVPEAVIKPSDVLDKRGVIDMLLSYKELRSLPRPNLPEADMPENFQSQETFPFPVEPLTRFILQIYKENAEGGTLSLIPAGRRAGEQFTYYAEQVLSFDWDDFYVNWDGEQFFDWFRRELEAVAEVVLIDSRTGVTEMSGVCTYHLADAVVLFVTPNQQSLNGTLMMARSLSDPKLVQQGRRGRPLSLLFVPSRMEHGEAELLDGFAIQFNRTLGSFVEPQLEFEKSAFIDLKIPYVPYYAYMENVAVREPERPSAADLVEAFEKLVSTLAQLVPETHSMSRLRHKKHEDISVFKDIFISNPFFYGNPISPDQFINRRRELRRIVSRIVNQGQSTAVVGEPRSGKTSLLDYLAAPEARQLYSACEKRLVFSYLDAQTLSGEFSQAQFWKLALRPLHERVIVPEPDSPLAQAYRTCQANAFGTFTLERLLAQMDAEGWRLLLLLDEFDVLLHHQVLSCAEFFGGLRSLASRSRGALALVIASRRPLEDLNKDTQQFSRTGSPYFNFLDEITLGPWPDKDVAELLRRAGDRFTADDRRFVAEVAGGHPYLVQVAAHELWEAYEEGERDPNWRRQRAGRKLYDEAARILGDTWQLWSLATRQAFTVVALAHVPRLLKQREFYVERLIRDITGLDLELRALAKLGFVAEDEAIPGGWRVRPQAFLWWLADELVRTVRDEPSFEEWLRAQGWEGLLTRDEKQQLDKGVRAIAGLLKGGVTTLIEAAAKGAGEVMLKGG